MAGAIAVTCTGTGPRIVFVRGAMTTGDRAWEKQRSLAARWTLVVPDRRGYGEPPADLSDFEIDAADIAEPLPPDVRRNVELLMNERPPWDVPIPVRALRLVPFPTLIVSGGHSPVFELMSDALASELGPNARARSCPDGATSPSVPPVSMRCWNRS